MALKAGLVGLPNVGKSTLFNALTKSSIPAANYSFCTVDQTLAITNVPDKRIADLAKVFGSQKLIPVTMQFVDIVGLSSGLMFAAAPQNIDGFTTIMSVLNSPGSFSALVGELQNSKTSVLLEKNTSDSKITLLAPTDKALNDFGQLGALRGTPLLEQFLKHHMISGRKDRKWLRSHRTVQMMSGKQINLKDIGKIAYTIETDNGIIHVIHKVVLHSEIKKKLGIKDS